MPPVFFALVRLVTALTLNIYHGPIPGSFFGFFIGEYVITGELSICFPKPIIGNFTDGFLIQLHSCGVPTSQDTGSANPTFPNIVYRLRVSSQTAHQLDCVA